MKKLIFLNIIYFLQILNIVRKYFGGGGDKRIKFTFFFIVFVVYRLVMRYKEVKEEVI